MGAGLYYGGDMSYFERDILLRAQRQKLEAERQFISSASITGGAITGGIQTIKPDKLDEDFFKIELPKLNQNN